MNKIPRSAQVFISLVALSGLATLGYGMMHWQSADHLRLLSFLVVAVLASRLKVSLPGVNGNMSVNLPFILLGVIELSLPESLLIACASTLIQCVPKPGKSFNPVQMMFNVCAMANTVTATYLVFHHPSSALAAHALMIVLATAVYLLANTAPVATIVALTEDRNVARVWYEVFEMSFPYFVVGAGIASIVTTVGHYVGWQAPLFVLPVMFFTYRSYKLYFKTALDTLAAKLHPQVAAQHAGD